MLQHVRPTPLKMSPGRFFKHGFPGRALMVLAVLWQLAIQGGAQVTSFTYQGRLNDGGGPAQGSYDFSFSVLDAAVGGNLVGSPVRVVPVLVTNGVFNTVLDFGGGVFNGAARWLELKVRTNGSAQAYATLLPRQPLLATPYAVHAVTASSINAANVVGVMSSNQLPANVAYKDADSPAGLMVASLDAQDAALVGKGYRNFTRIAAPAWANGSLTGMPAGRTYHTAIWTGQEMVVWGGLLSGGAYASTGARYNPDIDAWQPDSTANSPGGRARHTAVWTGTDMIVWGGFSGSTYLADGGRFSVASQTWSSVATTQAPTGRDRHSGVWTGSRMVIWGGHNVDTGVLADGAAYDPASNGWTALPSANAPAARSGAAAVWAEDRLLVWGGDGANGYLSTGGQLICSGGIPASWSAVTESGAPAARSGHTVVWTGKKMIVWGGQGATGLLADGGAYDPQNDLWTQLSTTNAPSPRMLHNAIWTGTEMVVYGGESASGALATGAAYDPGSDTWRTLGNPGAPQVRSGATTVWTGSEAIFFGGMNGVTPLAALQRLTPQPAWYLFRKL